MQIVMEFCGAGSVRRIMRVLDSPLSEMEISGICFSCLEGLAYLHDKRLIHRDIKADNILLCEDGSVKLGRHKNSDPIRDSHSYR